MTNSAPSSPTVEAAEELLDRSTARKGLLAFARYTMPSYQTSPHLELLADKLEAVERGEIKRLMVFFPPRHGKSELVSKRFPCWYLGRNPAKNIVQASYAESLALKHSREARDIFATPETGKVFPKVRHRQRAPGEIAQERQAAHEWGTSQGGGYYAVGIGGGLTGRGFNLGIIDDPVKDAEEAQSITYRNRVWEWYQTVFSTRAEPDAAIILVMTRWHEDDLAGRLLQAMRDGGEQWEVLRLPALAEEEDLMGREVDEPLWPDRYSKEYMEATKVAQGSHWWSALYQQRPGPTGGTLFKREKFLYFHEEGDMYMMHGRQGVDPIMKNQCWRFATVDLAASLNTRADYTVVMTFAVTPNMDLLLLDVARARLEGPDHIPFITNVYSEYHHGFIAIERAGFQLTTVQAARRKGLPIRELTADTDKWSRALPAAARMDAGAIYFKSGATWLQDLEPELTAFPNGQHDDQVDCLAYGAITIAPVPDDPKAAVVVYDAGGLVNMDL